MIDAGGARPHQLDGLRYRSLEILDALRAQLDGTAAWHPQLLKELDDARAEITAEK